jgi:hypothetical protein
LHEQLLAEEKVLHELKKSLHHMEQAVLRRLWKTDYESGLGG